MIGMFGFFVGLLFTFGGVGGIETSMTDGQLFYSTVWAVLGLTLMWISVEVLRQDGCI